MSIPNTVYYASGFPLYGPRKEIKRSTSIELNVKNTLLRDQ
jgi:hypothetical protein